MKKWILIFLCNSLFFCHANAADLRIFCEKLLQKNPTVENYSASFTEEFRKKVPLEALKQIFTEFYNEGGRCLQSASTSLNAETVILSMQTDQQLLVQISVHINKSENLFDGVSLIGITNPALKILSWEDVRAALSRFDADGKLSASLITKNQKLQLSINKSEVFAVGSTFKLYILGALEQSIQQRKHQWNQILPLKEEWKSLPSGIMHEWEAGKKISLYEYAEKMIALSDNTATDHLLYFLGRENVTNMLSPMGNIHQQDYLPFLGTLEMFKLKWGVPASSTQQYILMTPEERLLALEKLKLIPRNQVGKNGVDWNTPAHIDRLEWFATTEENCQAMFWLDGRQSPEVRSILSKNVPPAVNVQDPKSHWSYVGYKGGSEPGVLSMTFLLESRKGTKSCLSMSWNNKKRNVSTYRMMDLVSKTLKFAEIVVP